MSDFASSVRVKKGSLRGIELTGCNMFEWQPQMPGNIQPTNFEQKTALHFRLIGAPDYLFEIARYDSYDNVRNPTYPTTTNWGASLWNTEWDSTLSQNAGIGIGEAANWEPRLSTFLPGGDDATVNDVNPGIKTFLQHVHDITQCLEEIPNCRK